MLQEKQTILEEALRQYMIALVKDSPSNTTMTLTETIQGICDDSIAYRTLSDRLAKILNSSDDGWL